MSLFTPRLRLLSCLVPLLFQAAIARGQLSFQGLGTMSGGTFSAARAMSSDGSTVVGFGDSTEGFQAFRWTRKDGMQPLGDLPGGMFYSVAAGVSALGTTVVGTAHPAGSSNGQAFRWKTGTGMAGLPDLPDANFWCEAAAVSADGSVVVGFTTTNSNIHATRWKGGTPQDLGDLVTLFERTSYAFGVSADGSTVVGSSDNDSLQMEAFKWSKGKMVGLGFLPGGGFSRATAVSASGKVIVGFSDSKNGREAVRWNGGGAPQSLGDLSGGRVFSEAYAVSGDGSTIVGMGETNNGSEAFIWDAGHGMRRLRDVLVNVYHLNLNGWVLSEGTGVSQDGTFLCGNGSPNAWVVTLRGDRDGDGLYDDWESVGIDADGDGLSDLILPGADPDHKDVYVEVDAMDGFLPPIPVISDPTHAKSVPAAFARVPNNLIGNPDGLPGINLHVEMDEPNLPAEDWADPWPKFDEFRKKYFGTTDDRKNPARLLAKSWAYRYCVFAKSIFGDTTTGLAEGPGNEFMVTFGHPDWQRFFQNDPFGFSHEDEYYAGTFMHELGHTLGLQHGGGEPINHKPNYHSVMNYTWQKPNPLYWKSWELIYSESPMPDLDESKLSENQALGGHAGHQVPIGPPAKWRLIDENGKPDWSGDGKPTPGTVARDINDVTMSDDVKNPPVAGETLHGYTDWPNLIFAKNANWDEGVHLDLLGDGLDIQEMTWEDYAEMARIPVCGHAPDADGDGVGDGCDHCPETPAGAKVDRNGCQVAAADFDEDGDVDVQDILHLQGCVSGPAIPQTDPSCADADLDDDGDVDQSDFGRLQRCFSGVGAPAPDCTES